MISQGLPIYVALEPVDMRMGYERLGGLVRERMRSEPRSKALFLFVGKRGPSTIPGVALPGVADRSRKNLAQPADRSFRFRPSRLLFSSS